MFWTDDPVADFHRYDAEQTRWLQSLPSCAECGNRIQQEDAACVEGRFYCDECLNDGCLGDESLDLIRIVIGGD